MEKENYKSGCYYKTKQGDIGLGLEISSSCKCKLFLKGESALGESRFVYIDEIGFEFITPITWEEAFKEEILRVVPLQADIKPIEEELKRKKGENETLISEKLNLIEKNQNIENAYFKLEKQFADREDEMHKFYSEQKEKIDSLVEKLSEYTGDSPKENKELRDKIKILERKLTIAEGLYFKSVYEGFELE